MPNKIYIQKKSNRGFAALFVTILILAVILGVVVSITVLTVGEYRMSRNIAESSQIYYAAEAGVEDALLRLTKGMNWSSPYTLSAGGALSTIEISSILGGARTIDSESSKKTLARKIEVVYSVETVNVSFYYGAQVGEGGMDLGNNARISGNVFSNGSVIALTGIGYIDNSITVATNGNKIQGLDVGDDAMAHTCQDSTIGGDLTYVSTLVNCTAGGAVKTQPGEIDPKELPITLDQIDGWKTEASIGGILDDDYDLGISETASLGPAQIGTVASPKNLILGNNAVLTLTGTVYVTGDIVVGNNAIIQLNPSYGSTGGAIVMDGKINFSNNASFQGSGQPGSYLLVVSTNSSLDPASPAIDVYNNAEGAIFYTNSGLIYIHNNVIIKEVTGYKVKLDNNATVTYETGLSDASFSSGPGGSWEVISWREVE
ncbi:pilus assembly PilX N-terminal domain-containing protein [Patescibacteria group bacterium]